MPRLAPLTSALSSPSLSSSEASLSSSLHRCSRRMTSPAAAAAGERAGAVDAAVDAAAAAARRNEFRGRQDAPELGGRLVQWYPGHIAKAERRLKEALGKVDVVLEVLDARAPIASTHPMLGAWCSNSPNAASNAGFFIGSDGASSSPSASSSSSQPQQTGKPRILVLNRCDQVSAADRKEWDRFFRENVTGGVAPIWTDGEKGTGVALLKRAALAAAARANAGRARRGLAPRPARAVVVGLPNVGKSALINRLLGRRVAPSAPRPGVTRDLRWCRLRGAAGAAALAASNAANAAGAPTAAPSLDLLDAPGVVPPSLGDQRAAARLAACNDIGQAAYLESAVAAELVETLLALPSGRGVAAVAVLGARLRVPEAQWETAEDFLSVAASLLYRGDVEQAGARVLKDYRSGALGAVALEDAGEWGERFRSRRKGGGAGSK